MLARGVRNVIYNYTDAQRKVRSATSNDAWGPSPALMHEIADLTDNIVAYAEIMPIIWKRLNDHGKNWRHVYKCLVLLDHLIKYGNERVSQQCKENIFAIQTLKDFQYVEDQKDQGFNVREKAKQLVALLKDDERLRNERRKAQEGRARFIHQAIGMDSNGSVTYGRTTPGASMRRNSIEVGDPYGATAHSSSHNTSSYPTTYRSTSYNENLAGAQTKDFVSPASQEEEQIQIQIAMAESQREAEDEERRRRNDDLKLRIALERSVTEGASDANHTQSYDVNQNSQRLDASIFDSYPNNNPYSLAATTNSATPWTTSHSGPSNHHGYTTATNDPWALESNSRSFATAVPSEPWQGSTASGWQPVSTMPPANPWSGNTQTNSDNSAGLSINISDPWGLGMTNSRTTTLPPPRTTTTAIDNGLSEIFGASAMISASPHNHPQVSSNPWDISSSATTNYPSASINTGSISPPMTNLTMSGANLLYPTIASGNNSTPTSSSPLPSSLSASRKTPESFLGNTFSALVNLEKLVPDTKPNTNPFGSTAARTPNPFASATKAPTLEQLSTTNNTNFTSGSTLPPPLIPSSYNGNTSTIAPFNTTNPFM